MKDTLLSKGLFVATIGCYGIYCIWKEVDKRL